MRSFGKTPTYKIRISVGYQIEKNTNKQTNKNCIYFVKAILIIWSMYAEKILKRTYTCTCKVEHKILYTHDRIGYNMYRHKWIAGYMVESTNGYVDR